LLVKLYHALKQTQTHSHN